MQKSKFRLIPSTAPLLLLLITFFALPVLFILSPAPSCAAPTLLNAEKSFENFSNRKSKEEISKYIEEQQEAARGSLSGAPEKEPSKFTEQKRLAKAMAKLEKTIRQIQEKDDIYVNLLAQADNFQEQLSEITAADQNLSEIFAKVKAHLLDEALPDIILERHQEMVEDHQQKMKNLLESLSQLVQLSKSGKLQEAENVFEKIYSFLKTYQAVIDPPLLSSGLPHGFEVIPAPTIKKEVPVIPDLGPSQDVKATELIKEKSATTLDSTDDSSFSTTALTGPTTTDDLAATIDVQITPEIADLAASLDNDPLKIYRYVYDNFNFEAYLGSRNGSMETLRQLSGNDYDLSSLLIALLRASGIPARYVRGTVEMDADRVKNWLGVDDTATAGSILTTVGMEGVNIIDSGSVVLVRFRHVWVEAHIPYGNYRGQAPDGTGAMWVPMDPSIKEYTYHTGVDVLTLMGFDAQTFIDDYISTYHDPSPVEFLAEQIRDYLAANSPELSYDDILRTRTIVPFPLGFLPGSLPFCTIAVDSDFAEIPADKRYQVRFHLYNGATNLIDYTANMPEIAGKRVTISYVAASPADQAVIDSYGDLYDTPPYLVSLKPVLKIDDEDVAVGAAGVGMGRSHSSDMHFMAPTGAPNQMPLVQNSIISGTYQAIGINTRKIAEEHLQAREEENISTDDWSGGKLWSTAMNYLNRLVKADEEAGQTMQIVVTNDISEAIVENAILVTTSFGTPQTFEWSGLTVDADRNIVGTFAANGDSGKNKPFMVLTGADGSISENRIFEDTYGEEAVSTIKILELSSDMGIPICRITSSIAADCPELSVSSTVQVAVNNALAIGHEVTIPQQEITYYNWSGTGYIDMDPSTGAAGYIISGGNSGGATVDSWSSLWMTIFTFFKELCDTNPITAVITYPPDNSYFPVLSWLDFNLYNTLHFDVTYTICYKDGGSKTVDEKYYPHFAYPAGEYTFDAGWGTGATRKITMFAVEIETPKGTKAFMGCPPISLVSKFNPSAPAPVSFQWETTICLLNCGDGTFSAPSLASTDFEGTQAGNRTIRLKATNANGTTKAEKEVQVIDVAKLKAWDSDAASNNKEDTSRNVEADITTLYVLKKATGSVMIQAETNPALAESDLPADWKIEKVSGDLDFDGSSGKLSAKIKKDRTGEIVVKVNPCASYTGHFQLRISVMEVAFEEDTTQKYGFDNETDKNAPWKSVKKGDSDKAKTKTSPITAFSSIFYKSKAEAKVTVSPAQAASSTQVVTLTGVDKGESEIQANFAEKDGDNAAKMKAAVYNERTKTVAVILVHEDNDDVTEIEKGKGKADSNSITTGPDGICNTDKAGDDVYIIPKGNGLPHQLAMTAGADGVLNSTPGGDDVKVGTTITTGPNGVCNTTKTGDDVYVIPLNQGAPNSVALHTGPDGVNNSTKGGDDLYLIPKDLGLPNQVCIKAGANTKRDTVEAGDDVVVGEEINTGADGICNTDANKTDVMSTNLPGAANLATYLNTKVYNQGVMKWTVTFLPAKTVNFDLNRDGQVDVNSWMSAEMEVIRDECKNDTYDHNIFLVDNPNDGSLGYMDFNQRYGFVHVGGAIGVASLDGNHITAHELGHGGFGLRHPFEQGQPSTDTDNLMTWYADGSPWRLRKNQWDQINP